LAFVILLTGTIDAVGSNLIGSSPFAFSKSFDQ